MTNATDEGDIGEPTPPDEAFYSERDLPSPEREWRPKSLEEMREFVVAAPDQANPLVPLGGGEHLRQGAIGERTFDVLRTDGCDRIRAVDRDSYTVRVEAGVTWGRLREELDKQRLSVQRYGLQPSGATIGGLLARWQPLETRFHGGDLREGCIGLRSVTPADDGYGYLPAPRKATGPDHRYLYIGGEGSLGVILEATLVVARRLPGMLLEWPAETVADAVEAYRQLRQHDLDPSWVRWSSDREALEAGLHAPEELHDRHRRRLQTEIDADLTFKVDGAARERRRELEDAQIGGRTSPAADRTLESVWRISDLVEATDVLGEAAEHIAVDEWSLHHATVRLRGASGDISWEGKKPLMRRVLAYRRVVDQTEGVWPAWLQEMKSELDPKGVLAVGP